MAFTFKITPKFCKFKWTSPACWGTSCASVPVLTVLCVHALRAFTDNIFVLWWYVVNSLWYQHVDGCILGSCPVCWALGKLKSTRLK
jgi:hypothetical protein